MSSEEEVSPLFVHMAATFTAPLMCQGHRLLQELHIIYLPGQPYKAAVTIVPISQMGDRDTNRAAHPDSTSHAFQGSLPGQGFPKLTGRQTSHQAWGPTNLLSQPTLIEDT